MDIIIHSGILYNNEATTIPRKEMEAGPNKLFDDENFICVFHHCVHFIGCVNVFEEIAKEEGKAFTSIQLLNLRQLCHDCLDIFNNLSQNWDTKNDSQLNQSIIDTFYLIGEFNKLIDEDIKYLDEEAKKASLPEIVKRLELIIGSLISHREMLHNSKLNSSNISSAAIYDTSPRANLGAGLQAALFEKFNLLICRFNALSTLRQDTKQPETQEQNTKFLDSHSKPF